MTVDLQETVRRCELLLKEHDIATLKALVECVGDEVDVQFADRPDLPTIPIEPTSSDISAKNRTAHYLLLAASIDIGRIVGEAENARRTLSMMHSLTGDRLFEEIDENTVASWFSNIEPNFRLGPQRRDIPYYICKVNSFIRRLGGDLYHWGRRYSKPVDIINEIANKCDLGKPESARKRVCMFLRWMVRPKPDLRIWDHLSPRDLYLPLDKNVGFVLYRLGIIGESGSDNPNWNHVKVTTDFAKNIYPEDPVKVDYPFFLVGRWLRGKASVKKHCEHIARKLFVL